MKQGGFVQLDSESCSLRTGLRELGLILGAGVFYGVECRDAQSSCSVVVINCAPFHSLKCHSLKSQVMGVKGEEARGVRI